MSCEAFLKRRPLKDAEPDKGMGTSVVTLCTGTRDPEDMWRWHPENTSSQAWDELLRSMDAAFDGPLIFHGLIEAQVDASAKVLGDRLSGSPSQTGAISYSFHLSPWGDLAGEFGREHIDLFDSGWLRQKIGRFGHQGCGNAA